MSTSYRRISGADLAQGLASAGVTPEQFAALYGVPQRRVETWLSDATDIPHGVALFVGLIADPLVLEKALIMTKYLLEKSEAAEDEAEA